MYGGQELYPGFPLPLHVDWCLSYMASCTVLQLVHRSRFPRDALAVSVTFVIFAFVLHLLLLILLMVDHRIAAVLQ